LITSASGAVVRTTHLTGITTDLGIGIVRLMSLDRHDSHWRREWMSNMLRGGTIAFFVLGSFISAFIFIKIQFWGFLIPLASSVVILAETYRREHQLPPGLNSQAEASQRKVP
jgi:uncharacterized membrane protein YoaK (UPF0700 family)